MRAAATSAASNQISDVSVGVDSGLLPAKLRCDETAPDSTQRFSPLYAGDLPAVRANFRNNEGRAFKAVIMMGSAHLLFLIPNISGRSTYMF